jgi:two-component system, OmpR family, response regulator
MNVALIEDDPELARQVEHSLRKAGHFVVHHAMAGTFLEDIGSEAWDLMVLDVGLPDLDGFELIERIRASGHRQPVLFLTARDSVMDRVQGLTKGGDDYLTKPFAAEELLARVEALHRRAGRDQTPLLRKIGKWSLDPALRRLSDGRDMIELQPREWSLLEIFARNEGRVLTKQFLLEKAWGIRIEPGTNVVDAMICRLRRKLDESDRPSVIETVRGKGYVFRSIP